MAIFQFVREDQVVILERFGKFHKVATPGLLFTPIPFMWSIAGRLSTRMHTRKTITGTKTRDQVFVEVHCATMFRLRRDHNDIVKAYYKLNDAGSQIGTYVEDAVRSKVPEFDLDELYAQVADIGAAVHASVQKDMLDYGYDIVNVLVHGVTTAESVKSAMNGIEVSKKKRRTADELGQAERMSEIKRAEGEAEASRLEGVGVARQQSALVTNLKDSIKAMSDSARITHSAALRTLMMDQYFDTLRAAGARRTAHIISYPKKPPTDSKLLTPVRPGAVRIQSVEDLEERPLSTRAKASSRRQT